MRHTLPSLLAATVLLAGCGSLAPKAGKAPQPALERAEPAAPAAPDKSVESARKGGYYLDDGPGDNPPADIDAIPDAVPKVEPLLPRANRPYVALGETYTPLTRFQPYKAQGIASWYGRRYHGNKTASGEVYDMYGMTAAHPILPIPSYVRVTNPENGRAVVVRVNDRGPFKKDRLIDLSYAAAYKLRLVEKGSGLVEVEAIDPTLSPANPAQNPDESRSASGPYIQAGAFRQRENAEQLRERLRNESLAQNVGVESWYNDGIYRVRLGPYRDRQAAEQAAGQIKQTLGIPTWVISQ